MSGHGTIVAADGHRYDGGLKGCFPHGFGVMLYPDGASYDGEWWALWCCSVGDQDAGSMAAAMEKEF